MNSFYSDGHIPSRSLKPDMRCFVGVGAAIGLVSAGAGVFGSITAANATNSAAGKAANAQKQANDQNYAMYQESRGSKGSAILPTYLKNPDGSLFEGSLGNDLISAYNGSNVPLSDFQSATDRATRTFLPAIGKAGSFVNDIFNGGITDKLLAEAAPAQAARLSGARQSSMDALSKTLDSIDAAQAGKGFSGDSYGNRMLAFGARKSQGDAVSGANLLNLTEDQQIRNYGDVSLPLSNLNLPWQMQQQAGTQAGALSFLPQNEWLQSLQSRINPVMQFKIGTGNPPAAQPLPTAPPNSGVAGAIAGGVAGLGSTALNYYLQQQQQQNQLDRLQTIYGGTSQTVPQTGYQPPTLFNGSNVGDWSSASTYQQPVVAAPAPDATGALGF